MNLQVGILVALAAIIACGALLPRMNIGVLALVTTFLFGTLGSGLGVQEILGAFPLRLAFLIVGLSLFFGMLADNGTIERIAAFALRLVRGRAILVPLTVFALTALLTSLGVSNIAVTALMAPLAMKLAADVGLSPFLMTLIVVLAASGASFSPVSLSGIIVQEFVTRESQTLGAGFSFAPWRLFLFSFVGHGVVAFAGFHLFGGTAWLRSKKGELATAQGLAHQPLERIHVVSLVVFALFIAAVVLPGLPVLKDMMPASVRLLTENVALPALLCVAALMLLGVGSVSRGLALVPWNTLVLVVGMSTLIDFAARYDALSVLSRGLVDIASAGDVFFLFPLAGGVLSAFSSSSGVVLPLFLPMVGDFVTALPDVNANHLIMALALGSHIVDASPLSTLGALCVAAQSSEEARAKLFRALLVWGFVMVPVGAGLCWLVF